MTDSICLLNPVIVHETLSLMFKLNTVKKDMYWSKPEHGNGEAPETSRNFNVLLADHSRKYYYQKYSYQQKWNSYRYQFFFSISSLHFPCPVPSDDMTLFLVIKPTPVTSSANEKPRKF